MYRVNITTNLLHILSLRLIYVNIPIVLIFMLKTLNAAFNKYYGKFTVRFTGIIINILKS